MDTAIYVLIVWVLIVILAKLYGAAYGREAHYADLQRTWEENDKHLAVAKHLGIKGIGTIPTGNPPFSEDARGRESLLTGKEKFVMPTFFHHTTLN